MQQDRRPEAHRDAVDRGEQRFAERHEAVQEAVEGFGELVAALAGGTTRTGRGQSIEVDATREGPPGAHEQGDPDPGIAVRGVEHVGEAPVGLRGERVEARRPVEGDDPHRAVVVGDHGFVKVDAGEPRAAHG